MITNLPNEVWLPVPGWEALYSVSDCGRVRSERRALVLTPMLMGAKRKYQVVEFWRDGKPERCKVHLLVLHVFVGPRPPKNVGRHLDDDQFNNSLSNLCWGTKAQNGQDAANNFKCRAQVLTKAQHREIYERRCAGEQGQRLAAEFGVSAQLVCDIYKQRVRVAPWP
jgi:hypothetical protein